MSSVSSVADFEKYRLTVGTHEGRTLQLVSDAVSGINTWQTWKRKRNLGQGTFGEVWQEAWEDQHGDLHYRAVKVCSEAKIRTSHIDYKRELAALAAFSRSECASWFVNLHGWWMDSGNLCVAMEYLARGDLSRYITNAIPEAEIKEIVTDVLHGLAVMHDEHFTHRDIKPQNILVFRKRPEFHRWWVKIADFGLSKQVSTGAETALYSTVGTRSYCAPEVLGYVECLQGVSAYTSKVDMWSLGCVLFNVGSRGHPAFSDVGLMKYCEGRVGFNPDNLPIHLSDLGVLLTKTLLQIDPKQRPTAAEALHHPWFTTASDTVTSMSHHSISGSQANLQKDSDSVLYSVIPPYPSSNTTTTMSTMHSGMSASSRSTAYPSSTAYEDPIIAQRRYDKDLGGSGSPEILAYDSSGIRRKPVSSEYSIAKSAIPLRQEMHRIYPDQLEPDNGMERSNPGNSRGDLTEGSQGSRLNLNEWLAENEIRLQEISRDGQPPLFLAVEQGRLEFVKLLAPQVFGVPMETKGGWTLLHKAAFFGHLEVVDWLINRGMDINLSNKRGSTPLHYAAWNGRLEMVKWLVNHGAYVDSQKEGGFTPLFEAVVTGHLDVVNWLRGRNADINLKTKSGSTVLHCAAYHGRLEVVKELVDQGVDLSPRDRHNVTPLHEAAKGGHLEVAKWLTRRGADINSRNHRDETPLHGAADGGHLEVVNWLVSQGADINLRNKFGMTPLHYAAEYGDLHAIKWLVGRGADTQAKTTSARTALDVAVQKSHTEAAAWLREQTPPVVPRSKWRNILSSMSK